VGGGKKLGDKKERGIPFGPESSKGRKELISGAGAPRVPDAKAEEKGVYSEKGGRQATCHSGAKMFFNKESKGKASQKDLKSQKGGAVYRRGEKKME